MFFKKGKRHFVQKKKRKRTLLFFQKTQRTLLTPQKTLSVFKRTLLSVSFQKIIENMHSDQAKGHICPTKRHFVPPKILFFKHNHFLRFYVLKSWHCSQRKRPYCSLRTVLTFMVTQVLQSPVCGEIHLYLISSTPHIIISFKNFT